MLELMNRGWQEALLSLIERARRDIFLVSPFVSAESLNVVRQSISRGRRESLRVRLLTNLSPKNIVGGATDVTAIRQFAENFSSIQVIHQPSLHAKVYLIDRSEALVTSANLTPAGLNRNFEYGIRLRGTSVSRIRTDLERWIDVSPMASLAKLADYEKAANDASARYAAMVRNSKQGLLREYRRSLKSAQSKLREIVTATLTVRGDTIHAVFSRSILHLLITVGPLSTKQIHPLIQEMHPELCDDTVDLVFNGERYGRKWKWKVRQAQSSLQKTGRIDLERQKGAWFVVPGTGR